MCGAPMHKIPAPPPSDILSRDSTLSPIPDEWIPVDNDMTAGPSRSGGDSVGEPSVKETVS